MAVGEARPSRSDRSDAVRFEARRNMLVPAHADVAVLELEGAFHASARRSVGRPRLIVTTPDGNAEVKAVDAHSAYAGPDPRTWTASFAVPRPLAEADGATFALAIGRSLVLELPTPERGALPVEPQGEVEGYTWGSMVVDLSEAQRELSETQDELTRAREEIERLRAAEDAPEAAAAEAPDPDPKPERPRVTWLEEVEAETVVSANGDGPHVDAADHEHDDEEDDDDALPVLTGRRVSRPATMEHDVVYEATLKRVQVERRARMRRRRILGRLLALLVFLLAAAAIYIVVTGAVGVDLLEIF